MLVAHMPTPVWCLDPRGAYDLLEPLRREAEGDFAGNLARRPDLLEAAVDRLEVVEANGAAATLMEADNCGALLASARLLLAATPGLAARMLAAGLAGEARHEERARLETFTGEAREVVMTVAFAAADTLIVTVQDITEHLWAVEQLRRLRAEMAHAARISLLGELATSIAHEVRQPLAAIVTNADTSLRWLARDEPNVEKVGELTARIAASAHRASDIIQRVRDMALKHEPVRERLDLAEVVEGAQRFVRHELDTRGIDLVVSLPGDRPQVTGDRVQLQQVVVNLLVNAVHALDQQPGGARRIAVQVERLASGGARLTVQDNGPGFAAADAARLFEGFYSTKATGMGIGLTICRSIVTDHGGEIGAENDPVGGAIFRVELPPADEEV